MVWLMATSLQIYLKEVTIWGEDGDGTVVAGSHGSQRCQGGSGCSSGRDFQLSKSDLFLFSAKVPIHCSVAVIEKMGETLACESTSF